MKISVCYIDEEGFEREHQQVVRIDFCSTVVRGSAHLVATNLTFGVGDELDVEIDYFRCENFDLAFTNENVSVQYNEELNFYLVSGLVTTVYEDGVFWIEVDDFHAMLEPIDNLRVQKGDCLQFALHGLKFWPIHI